MRRATFRVTVHPVTLRRTAVGVEVLLIQRAGRTFWGAWSLPGGHLEVGERAEGACLRELLEEAGIKANLKVLSGVYTDPGRDPRAHAIGIAYICEPAECDAVPVAGDDALHAEWVPVDALPPMAFDHRQMVLDALDMTYGAP